MSIINNFTFILRLFQNTYNPRRRFLQKNVISRDEFSIVSNTLLEYGEVLRIHQIVINILHKDKCNSSLEDTEITKEMIEKKIQEKVRCMIRHFPSIIIMARVEIIHQTI